MGIGSWYGETGLMLTTQFFGLKIERYMHDQVGGLVKVTPRPSGMGR